MLMLLFYVGDNRYALESKLIVEIVPLVELKNVHHAPDYVAGLFNYRSQIVPVIDLCHLIRGSACKSHLSTRIILVNYLDRNQTPHLLGLIAEMVTETVQKPENEFVDPGFSVDSAPYLGKMITDEQGIIQCVRVEYLLQASQSQNLLSEYKG